MIDIETSFFLCSIGITICSMTFHYTTCTLFLACFNYKEKTVLTRSKDSNTEGSSNHVMYIQYFKYLDFDPSDDRTLLSTIARSKKRSQRHVSVGSLLCYFYYPPDICLISFEFSFAYVRTISR